MRERERQKREQEQDALTERHKREQEQKRKQDAMTMEEIKDTIGKLENKLEELRQEKHNLFLQLKKVLHEDETRRKERENLIAAQSVAQTPPSTPHAYQPYYISGHLLASGGRPNALYPKLTPFSAGVAPPHLQGPPTSNMPPVTQPTSRTTTSVEDVRKLPLKRPHERSPSPQSRANIPYTGNFPNYKNPISYTISESKCFHILQFISKIEILTICLYLIFFRATRWTSRFSCISYWATF